MIREATSHLIIVGLPKCGNVFFSSVMERTLGCAQVMLCTRANIAQQIMPDRLMEFVSLPRAVGGQHMPPTEFNLRLLEAAGIERIALLFRDPRDALISWWHHLRRPDIATQSWVGPAMFAAGLQSRHYFDLSPHDQLRDLAGHAYPRFQEWMASWLALVDGGRAPFRFHVNRYELFQRQQTVSVADMLRFFGHDVAPVLPQVERQAPTGIELNTHFRRGVVGTFRDEAPPELVAMLNAGLDPALAERFGWPRA